MLWHLVALVVLTPNAFGWQFGIDLDGAVKTGDRDYLERTGHSADVIDRILASRERTNMRTGLACALFAEVVAMSFFNPPYTQLGYFWMYFAFAIGAGMLGVTIWAIAIAIRGKL